MFQFSYFCYLFSFLFLIALIFPFFLLDYLSLCFISCIHSMFHFFLLLFSFLYPFSNNFNFFFLSFSITPPPPPSIFFLSHSHCRISNEAISYSGEQAGNPKPLLTFSSACLARKICN